MHCNTIIETYLLLDRHKNLPFKVKIHCITCKKCRNLVYKIEQSINLQQEKVNEPTSFEDALLCATMDSIYKLKEEQAVTDYKKNSSFYSWLIIGIILIIGFIAIPFSEIGQQGLEQFGTQFTISFALLCAGSITAYAAMFLVKNITFFTKILHY